MAGRGRVDKYYTNVEPRLKDIETFALTMTEEQMAKVLGVGITSWKKYKKIHPSLVAALKKGRDDLVGVLKSKLIEKATGFQYEEKKIIREGGIIVREETYIKQSLPDVAALNLLLKNYDADNWANDPQMLKIREKELEIKEKQVENNIW